MDVTPAYLPRLETLLPILRTRHAVWRADRPFSRQSWQNRTRLRNPDGWQWITVPVEHGQFGESIANTAVAYHDGWRKRHLKALQYNYSTSPFYQHYAGDISDILGERHATLHALNKAVMDMILGWLKHEITWEVRTDSTVALISGAASDRIQPHPAGPADSDADPASVFEHPVYRQNYDGFIPDMSCLDILFTNGPSAIHQLATS